MRKTYRTLACVRATVAATAMMFLSGRSALAELSLDELMHKCLLLEDYWAMQPAPDTPSSIPNDGSAVCFGYLLAFRGLQGTAVGIDCTSAQSCRQTLRFCITEQTTDAQMLSAFIVYGGSHVGQWHDGASIHYLKAMHEAFPCKASP
jgi:hypothetical protein